MKQTTHIVEERGELRLVSWLYKDKTHYRVEDLDGKVYAKFVPSKQCQGHSLRAKALKYLRETPEWELLQRWPLLTLVAEEIAVNDVMVYESQLGKVAFAKVVKVDKNLISTVDQFERRASWLVENMQEKLLDGRVKVISLESVPKEIGLS